MKFRNILKSPDRLQKNAINRRMLITLLQLIKYQANHNSHHENKSHRKKKKKKKEAMTTFTGQTIFYFPTLWVS